jgi:hypothetical protein
VPSVEPYLLITTVERVACAFAHQDYAILGWISCYCALSLDRTASGLLGRHSRRVTVRVVDSRTAHWLLSKPISFAPDPALSLIVIPLRAFGSREPYCHRPPPSEQHVARSVLTQIAGEA